MLINYITWIKKLNRIIGLIKFNFSVGINLTDEIKNLLYRNKFAYY